MIPYGPTWRTERRTAVQLTFTKDMTAEEVEPIKQFLEAAEKLLKLDFEVTIGQTLVAVTFTPDRPASETTPQPGYVPPVSRPPGR